MVETFLKTMSKIKKVFAIASISSVLGFFGVGISAVFAQTQAPITNRSGLVTLFCSIINWFIVILLAISVIMVLVAAYDYVTAQEDVEKTSKARRTLTYAAVGIAVTLIAYGFPQIVATVLPGNPTVSAFTCSGSSSGGNSTPYGPNSD
jgi:cytochrome bd-type quinol oxidase subunit 2